MDPPPTADVGVPRRRSLDFRSASYSQLSAKDLEGGRAADKGTPSQRGNALHRSETDFGQGGGMDVAVKVGGVCRGGVRRGSGGWRG